MLRKITLLSLIMIFAACAPATTPLKESQSAVFGQTGRSFDELIRLHPQIDQDTVKWAQSSPAQGELVECRFRLQPSGYFVLIEFSVTSKSVIMRMGKYINPRQQDGFMKDIEPKSFMEALENKTEFPI